MIKKILVGLFSVFVFVMTWLNFANAETSTYPHWTKTPITVYIPKDENAITMKHAFEKWQNMSFGKLKFQFMPKGPADIDVIFVDKVDGSDGPLGSNKLTVKKGIITKAEIKIATKGNKKYSKELKQQAVLDYLAGHGSQNDICKKYGIRSKGKLQTWIKKYNGHEELKSSGTGGSIIMTKGRKTTFEERVEIVQYCIAHDRNYAQTAEQYQVSYQQARNYIVKYEAGGVEALRDNRGKRKRPDEMSELEKLRAEVKILKAEKERAEMEASFLKKLEEIERRRG